ncbi:MAG: hypothetical protein JWN77_2561 [Frankiales bacterium]|nr:hypothetical protein [Frankiales bacterium]
MEEPSFTSRRLPQRLLAANAQAADPLDTWQRLREHEGAAATVVDLYLLEAHRRGVPLQDLTREDRGALGRATLPVVWPDFQATTGSDRTGDEVVVVDYDPDWPRRYEQWRTRLAQAMGTAAVQIEHVGSTSVPGLPAKPIIDIQISVADVEDEDAYVPAIEAAGVQLRSRDALHRYFRPYPDQPRDVHVHVCAVGSTWEREHLLFRDHLRSSPTARARYAEVKRAAAARWRDDGFAYTDTKTEVILDLLGQATST